MWISTSVTGNECCDSTLSHAANEILDSASGWNFKLKKERELWVHQSSHPISRGHCELSAVYLQLSYGEFICSQQGSTQSLAWARACPVFQNSRPLYWNLPLPCLGGYSYHPQIWLFLPFCRIPHASPVSNHRQFWRLCIFAQNQYFEGRLSFSGCQCICGLI